MKAIAILIILAVGGYFGWQAIQTKPDASVPQATVSDNTNNPAAGGTSMPAGRARPINNEKVAVSFKGFGPGKVHNGSFGKVTSDLVFGDDGLGIKGTVTVDVGSLTTDTDGVTKHLKTDAFFDVAKYPTAKFVIASENDMTFTGAMTIHGVTKTISFPVTYSDTEMAYKSTFTLNMKDFGIDQTFANETIELSVVVPLL
jgi:polyisoprenoid-binding protein YceI